MIAGEIEAVVRPAAQDDAQEARDRARMDRELADAEGMLAAARGRLANEAFVSKAPPAVVEGARARAAELEEFGGCARLAERRPSVTRSWPIGVNVRRTGQTIRGRC